MCSRLSVSLRTVTIKPRKTIDTDPNFAVCNRTFGSVALIDVTTSEVTIDVDSTESGWKNVFEAVICIDKVASITVGCASGTLVNVDVVVLPITKKTMLIHSQSVLTSTNAILLLIKLPLGV